MKGARFFLWLLVLLPAGPVAAQQTPPPEWFKCSASADCEFVQGMCSDNMVINRQFEKAYAGMRAHMKLPCAKIEPRVANATPSCDEGYCVMETPFPYERPNQ